MSFSLDPICIIRRKDAERMIELFNECKASDKVMFPEVAYYDENGDPKDKKGKAAAFYLFSNMGDKIGLSWEFDDNRGDHYGGAAGLFHNVESITIDESLQTLVIEGLSSGAEEDREPKMMEIAIIDDFVPLPERIIHCDNADVLAQIEAAKTAKCGAKLPSAGFPLYPCPECGEMQFPKRAWANQKGG